MRGAKQFLNQSLIPNFFHPELSIAYLAAEANPKSFDVKAKKRPKRLENSEETAITQRKRTPPGQEESQGL